MTVSFWERESFLSGYDVIIVGGGLVGIDTAITLKEKNPTLKIAVIDRYPFSNGASTKNAGFACFGSISEILDDLKTCSEEEVFGLVEKRYRGIELLKKRTGEKNIGFEQNGEYEIFTSENETEFHDSLGKLDYINRHLKEITGQEGVFSIAGPPTDSCGLTGLRGMFYCRPAGQLDSGKLLHTLIKIAQSLDVGLLGGITYLSHEIGKNISVKTSEGYTFKTDKLLFATNAFTKNIFPDLDIQPARGQVLLTEPIEGLKVKGTFHYDKGYYYFRNLGNRILLGGARNSDFEAENTFSMNTTRKIQDNLEAFLKNVILPEQDYKIEMRWSGIMGTGQKKLPIIKELEPGVWVAARMGGMGVALSQVVAEEVSELI